MCLEGLGFECGKRAAGNEREGVVGREGGKEPKGGMYWVVV